MSKTYLNMKTSHGVETVDELDRANFPTYRAYSDEIKRLKAEYHLCGMPVYSSQRSTSEWRLQDDDKRFQVWDMGESHLDRYTVIEATEKPENSLYNCLCLCSTGKGVNMFGEAQKGKHLGKRVQFSSLSSDLQKTIKNRF